ncbi:hypothetical protein PR048_033230 [Dryococelus australis]|uniref:Uncharacterized protein n=1 Tax=Dryococelus australis TaxID=614101 RepID=A0ABQ9FZQ2_9NEOP|nr:hypothetical protein PR048_033230 [Dryococelus australis]
MFPGARGRIDPSGQLQNRSGNGVAICQVACFMTHPWEIQLAGRRKARSNKSRPLQEARQVSGHGSYRIPAPFSDLDRGRGMAMGGASGRDVNHCALTSRNDNRTLPAAAQRARHSNDAVGDAQGDEVDYPAVLQRHLVVSKLPTCSIHMDSRNRMHPQMHVAHMMNDTCVKGEDIWAVLNIEVVRADEGEARCVWSSDGIERGKRETPEKTRGAAASYGATTKVRGSGQGLAGNRARFALASGELSEHCTNTTLPADSLVNVDEDETDLLTNSQCDNRAEHPSRRGHRGANPRPSDYRSATLPLCYEGRAFKSRGLPGIRAQSLPRPQIGGAPAGCATGDRCACLIVVTPSHLASRAVIDGGKTWLTLAPQPLLLPLLEMLTYVAEAQEYYGNKGLGATLDLVKFSGDGQWRTSPGDYETAADGGVSGVNGREGVKHDEWRLLCASAFGELQNIADWRGMD